MGFAFICPIQLFPMSVNRVSFNNKITHALEHSLDKSEGYYAHCGDGEHELNPLAHCFALLVMPEPVFYTRERQP